MAPLILYLLICSITKKRSVEPIHNDWSKV